MNKTTKPEFRSEAEEADWYHTEAGREHSIRLLRQAIRKGKIVVEEKMTALEAAKLAKETGKLIVIRNGSRKTPRDPAVVTKLLEEARASMTQAISLRLPVRDLDAAKALAAETGRKYQSVLKELIHLGLAHYDVNRARTPRLPRR